MSRNRCRFATLAASPPSGCGVNDAGENGALVLQVSLDGQNKHIPISGHWKEDEAMITSLKEFLVNCKAQCYLFIMGILKDLTKP